MRSARTLAGLALGVWLSLSGPLPAQQPGLAENFGFPPSFSTRQMDTASTPEQNFPRYASGRWVDAARIPPDILSVGPMNVAQERLLVNLLAIAHEQAAARGKAARGTPEQLVGDFFASGLDVERRNALGVRALANELELIESVQDEKSFARVSAQLGAALGNPAGFAVLTGSDTSDRSRYAIYVADGELPLGLDYYLKPEYESLRRAYVKSVAAYFQLTGASPAEAEAIGERVLQREIRIAGRKLTPSELRDPHKRFVKTSLEDLKKSAPHLDFQAQLGELGLPTPGEVIVVDGGGLSERSKIVAAASPQELQEMLRWDLLRYASGYLGDDFARVGLAWAKTLYGQGVEASAMERQVLSNTIKLMGHPLAQLYVRRHFSEQSRRDVEHLVGLVRAELRRRLENNRWLSEPTRLYALKKLDALKVYVGYPDKWIDYSSVEIRPDDYVGNFLRLNRFSFDREVKRYGKPVVVDGFSVPGSTLPIDINAAYSTSGNQIEIPAAFLQPPFYDPKAGVAVNLGAMGAVIGHEFTHGFDSLGRQYDAEGKIRDWWTAEDAKKFAEQNQRIVEQANAFEIDGVHLNGVLESGENLADIGGVSMAFAVLKAYLADHPEERATVDGLTPEQRFFLAWSQLWSEKANPEFIRQTVAKDPHPPGLYRQLAPCQHESGFYEAFKIGPGTKSWLDESRRAQIW